MTENRVTIDMSDGVADVRLNRSDKLNALDRPMFDGIVAAIDRLATMPGLRCVVLSGEGRAFCAGLDLAAMAAGGSGIDLDDRRWGDANIVQQMAWGWRTLPVPVIAAVRGIAFGGGFQIMSGADIRIVAPDTRFAIMEMKWGLVPDMAGFALWRGLVRDDVLRELTYTAREFDTSGAVEYGFVTHVADDPYSHAMSLAREIAERSPDAIRAAKRLANLVADNDGKSILLAESKEQAGVIRQPNQVEAVMAGMAKRKPVFAD